MGVDVNDVRHLNQAHIREGDRLIYIADFNIKHEGEKLKSTNRVDAEIKDLQQIIRNAGVPVILAHSGRYADRDTEELDFVVPYLASTLDADVKYFSENTGPAAQDFVSCLAPGTVAIMGNTRKHEGEEKNDDYLASLFSALAGPDSRVAVGGFGKAHRVHASNSGILKYLRGYATDSQLDEMVALNPWAGANPDLYSVAVLGGVKKEKITTGLDGFVKTYDLVIPGGIVLNTILLVKGYAIGDSKIDDGGKTFDAAVKDVLSGSYSNKIIVPDEVVIAKKNGDSYVDIDTIKIARGVPDGHMIVDYVMPDEATEMLDKVVSENGRLILAGTPGIYKDRRGETLFKGATEPVLERMRRIKENCIVLGGDTAGETGYDGPVSTGGGSALYFVVHGTTPVFEALKENRVTFG